MQYGWKKGEAPEPEAKKIIPLQADDHTKETPVSYEEWRKDAVEADMGEEVDEEARGPLADSEE